MATRENMGTCIAALAACVLLAALMMLTACSHNAGASASSSSQASGQSASASSASTLSAGAPSSSASSGDVQSSQIDSASSAGGTTSNGTQAEPQILYLGHASLRIVTPEDKVIYIDPFAGDAYDLPADLVLITHGHYDHNALDKVAKRNEDCRVITQDDALSAGLHEPIEAGFATVIPVQAGFNQYHDASECVGYVVKLDDGTSIYASGDTSTTDDMRDGTLAQMGIDYAFVCTDGVYNMGPDEAAEAARMTAASHNIAYHTCAADSGELFDPETAAAFDAPNALVLQPGESISL